jgi:hypothetical protein
VGPFFFSRISELGRRTAAATLIARGQTFEVVEASPVPMKELTAVQIAATIAGYPGGAEQELRLLMLFQSAAGNPVEVEPEAREPLS